jgi:branched-chain amino acid aminotransferase
LRGITRASVIEMCHHDDTPVFEKDFSLTQVYSADEAFVTGTFAGLTPVTEVDGRIIGDGQRGPMTERLQGLFQALIAEECPHE